MAEKPKITSELSRELNLFHVTMMGMGMMIGAGVFLGMGISIGNAGPGGVVLTFSLNGLLAVLTAMSFAELSSAIPRAGGVYNFARVGFGRGTSFLAGWMEWFASSVAGAMYALTFAIYTVRYVKALGGFGWLFSLLNIESGSAAESSFIYMAVKITAVITAGLFIYINFRGASETGKIGAIITMGQTIFVVVIGITGILVAIKEPSRLANFTPFMPAGWSKLLITMGFTYVAFEGYEVIAQAGDETINPRQNLPKAMIYSVLIVTLIYVLVAFATVVSVKAVQVPDGTAPWQWIGSFGEKGFGEAVAKLMPMGNFILTIAVIFSSTSALNATVFSATRASYALGRDKMLPGVFSAIHKKRKTPYGALIITGIIVLIVATVLPTKDVASSASIMFLFLFFLVNLCVIKIRLNMADELTYGFLMPLFPLFPVLALIAQAVLAVWLIHMSLIAWIIAPLWILSGLAVYFVYSKSRAEVTDDEILVLDEKLPATDDSRYSVMVSVANPANAVSLVQSTYKICGAKNAKVELLHMAPVPSQVSLHDAEKYITQGKESLAEAMLYLAMHFPISFTIRYCRNIARGIVSALRQKKINLLVMGWHGKPKSRLFSLGSTIDPVIERSPCDIVILKDCGRNQEFKNSLVLAGGGANSALALEIASILTSPEDGQITVLTVDTGRRDFDVEQWFEENRPRLQPESAKVITKTIKSRSVRRAVLGVSKHYDLVLLGTTNRPLLANFGKASLPDTIACRCNRPVVITKSGGTISSWIKRWI
ncbi:MAG: amino acid permease [Anaerohalosphaeraceae bacterium]|nr:amino acid permease [Anaerohalosphaeraceae bacterium]